MDLSMTMRIATGGMATQADKLAGAARAIAQPEAGGPDMAEALVSVIEADIGYRANASVFETGADLWDLLLTIPRD